MGHVEHGPQAPRLEGLRAWHGISYKKEKRGKETKEKDMINEKGEKEEERKTREGANDISELFRFFYYDSKMFLSGSVDTFSIALFQQSIS